MKSNDMAVQLAIGLMQGDCPKKNKYCDRGYDRVCLTTKSIPFFEFRWGYFFNDAFNNPVKLWVDVPGGFDAFNKMYSNLLPTSSMQDWGAAASSLVALARSRTAGGRQGIAAIARASPHHSFPAAIRHMSPVNPPTGHCFIPL